MDVPVWVLLPSPLLGPAVWRGVGDVLRSRGLDVVHVPAPDRAPATAEQALVPMLAAIPTDRPVVLVPHSNAGLFVPSLIRERDVQGSVFVDAGLPPSSSPYAVTDQQFKEFLAGIADDDGVLPLWTDWWGDGAVLFPDDESRAAVVADQLRLPLAYFDTELTFDEGWDDRSCSYLAFGETYADEYAFASLRGWEVERLPGDHLHMLADPAGVADAIVRLSPWDYRGLGTRVMRTQGRRRRVRQP